jgi:transposase
MFPPIPENTIRTARASYGKGNIYLRLGDQLNELISRLNSNLLIFQSDGYSGTLLAALTLVQYVEGLTDVELTESLPGRIDLRYALHLPTPGPRIDPFTLCAFRQRVLMNHPYHLLLEEIFKVLYPELVPDEAEKNPEISVIVRSICVNTIRACVVEAMFHAIEALSANHFTWLRQVAPPHWYERYSPSLLMFNSGLSIKQKDYSPNDLRTDIEYLLQTADQSASQTINEVPEIKTLRSMWDQLLHYRPDDQCSYCFNNRFERRTTFNSTNENLAQA